MYLDCNLGAQYAGLSNVGCQLFNSSGFTVGGRVLAAVDLGSGVYGADVPVPAGFTGTAFWDCEVSGVVAAERITNTTSTVKLAADGLDDVMVEASLNARQALSITTAMVAGVLSGAGDPGGVIIVKAAGTPATTRVTAATTGEGNRTTMILNPPA
jgi:hypothetical protein